MVRLWVALGVALAVFYVYSIVDAALSPTSRIRNLPKPLWLLIIVIVPIFGSILWFALGRGWGRTKTGTRMTAPDDDPDFLRTLAIGDEGPRAPDDHSGA